MIYILHIVSKSGRVNCGLRCEGWNWEAKIWGGSSTGRHGGNYSSFGSCGWCRKLIDMSAPLDIGTESNLKHNFELPISLASLQKFGKPQGAQKGFLARKQRIEAIVGCQVPDNDGRRRRGLL